MKKCNYAKINLALNVTNKNKPNGNHDLDMINFCISLKDYVTIEFIEDNNNTISITSNNKLVPLGSENLVYKVIEKFKRKYKLNFSCKVHINKKIPIESGMAGGTGNGVAALEMLDKKFKTNLTVLQKMKFMEDLASDGPYMVASSICRVKGKGEKIIPLKAKLKYKVLVIKPKTGCSTKEVFSSLDYKNLIHPNINKVEDALIENNLNQLSNSCNNSLTDSAIKQNEELLDLLNRLRTCGFDVVSMSGSGSTCFAFSNKKLPYKLAKEIIKKSNYELVGTYKVINKKIF